MADIKLPELGEGVTEGELVKWLVKPGDSIKPDQSVAELMTDKATVEIPSPMAGVVKTLKFKVGDVIKVESVILTLDPNAITVAMSAPAASVSAAPAAPTATAQPPKPVLSAPTSLPSTPTGLATSIPVKLPELGEGVSEGELVKWLVKPGDLVKADQSIAELMTDKATVEVPSPFVGKVKEIKFKVGDVVKVDSVMLILEGTSSSATTSVKASPTVLSQTGPLQKSATLSMAATNPPPAGFATASGSGAAEFYPPVAESRVLATPATRRLAREMGVNINSMTGTGLAGRVTRDDVLSSQSQSAFESGTAAQKVAASSPTTTFAYQSPQSLGPLEERVALRGIRKKIAENLQMAKSIIPHFTLMDEADVTELVTLRENLKDFAAKSGTKVTFLPFVMKAMIATIREFPMFNASIDDKASEIIYKKYFNVGFAADTPNGLVVPVIKNADQKSILEISREILDLAKRARDGKLKSEEMKGATITITNIGSVGGTYATPIINHPEVAILGMYKIQDKPIIKNGALAVQKVMNYTVTADHRLIDGAVAANFLKAFIQRIEKPGSLMLEMR
ncbi:MAG: dihydrolipoyllysine-residue acetyltransferase [Bdellovibrionaceae bacterium]|nr:dihydrolipoyllysine-residue acetyltransferase [Pseudobdellovibrionaceae bacterium]